MANKITNRQLYQLVWHKVQAYIDLEGIKASTISLDDLHNDQIKFPPFILATVQRNGQYCCTCSWIKKCYGCIIPYNDQITKNLVNDYTIAIDWNPNFITNKQIQYMSSIYYHNSYEIAKTLYPSTTSTSVSTSTSVTTTTTRSTTATANI